MQKGGVTGREQDNTRESLLYFEGPLEVQGLFEYLFNESKKVCGDECDVPLLMAPAAFPGACLKQLHPKVCSSLISQASSHLKSLATQKKRKEKTTPFGVKIMRSQVLYRAAQFATQNKCKLQWEAAGYKANKLCPNTRKV